MSRDTTKNDFLDFELDKTHQTFFESGKIVGSAFLTYLLLQSLTAILVFGKGLNRENFVQVPFLQLAIEKNYAALSLLILTCGALYWYFSAVAYEALLAEKLYDLLNKRYNTGWYTNLHLRYPSIYAATNMVALFGPRLFLRVYLNALRYGLSIGITSVAINSYLAWRVGKALGLCLLGCSLWLTFFLLLLTPAALAFSAVMFLKVHATEKIIARMIEPKQRDYDQTLSKESD